MHAKSSPKKLPKTEGVPIVNTSLTSSCKTGSEKLCNQQLRNTPADISIFSTSEVLDMHLTPLTARSLDISSLAWQKAARERVLA